MLPPLGAQTPASRILRINSFGTGSGLSRRIERVVLMISNRSMPWFSFGMASSPACDGVGPRLSDRAAWCKDRLGAESTGSSSRKDVGLTADHQYDKEENTDGTV